MTSELAQRPPVTALEHAETWAALADEERKRRAALALRDGDRAELFALLRSYHLTFSRKGLRTSENTLDSYRVGMGRLLDWCEENARKPHQLTRQDALRYRGRLEAEFSPATVNARLAAARKLAAALEWAGMMDADPFRAVSVEDPTPQHEKRDRYTDEELAALLAEAGPRERALVLLGSDGGLRAAELAGLDWSDVDMPAGRLTVRSGKGRKKRTIGLTSVTVEALQELDNGTGAVFGVTRRRLHAILAALCRRAGVASRGLHSLRHSCGTRLHQATGGNLLVTARHLGHSSTQTTEIYAEMVAEDYDKAIAALGKRTSDRGG